MAYKYVGGGVYSRKRLFKEKAFTAAVAVLLFVVRRPCRSVILLFNNCFNAFTHRQTVPTVV